MNRVTFLKKTIGNEGGFVLGVAILVSAILVLTGVLAIWTSNTEVTIVRNEGQMIREFYDAEAGLIDAIDNYPNWLTNDFLTGGESAGGSLTSEIDGKSIATVEVRAIQDGAFSHSELSAAANQVPGRPHIELPPDESGNSLKHFIRRNYAVTATSTNGNTIIQTGTWKLFNRF
jgi:hypothetical protein